MIDRRTFIAGAAVLAAPRVAAAAAAPVVRPEEFGARGDGRTDDTSALQAALRAAPRGTAVELRSGAVYRVDTNWQPTHAQFGGLQFKHGQLLRLNGGELRALPSIHNQGQVIGAYEVHGWRIEGPGRITGERYIHRGEGGEWGMGIAAWASNDWSIGPGIEISKCWGDGIYLGYTRDQANYCENFVIDRPYIWDCRRCGIGLVAGRNGEILSPHIHKIDGTGPAAGIDLEADLSHHYNRNIRMVGGRIYDCQIGVDVAQSNQDILVTGMDLVAENSALIIAQNAHRISILGNKIRSTLGGREGAAMRTAVYDNSRSVQTVRMENNDFSGGGDFVLDIVGDEYQDFRIANNRLHASNPGVQGVARLGRVTFVDNECVVGANAGKPNDYFLYFGSTTHGGNVYRNLSPHSMYSILSRDHDLGGDRYVGPNLRRHLEPR